MPTYDYLCSECNFQFEYFQAMSDEPLNVCPQCSGPVRRLVSGGTGLIFKGSGFYLTDYKKKSSSQTSANTSKSTNDTAGEKSKTPAEPKKESN